MRQSYWIGYESNKRIGERHGAASASRTPGPRVAFGFTRWL
jgi:hypothetical protein